MFVETVISEFYKRRAVMVSLGNQKETYMKQKVNPYSISKTNCIQIIVCLKAYVSVYEGSSANRGD